MKRTVMMTLPFSTAENEVKRLQITVHPQENLEQEAQRSQKLDSCQNKFLKDP